MTRYTYLISFIILFLGSCSTNKNHWTGVPYPKADYYVGLKGNQVTEFQFGQQLNYGENIPYVKIQEDGKEYAYMYPYSQKIRAKNGFYSLFAKSLMTEIDSNSDINIVYITDNSIDLADLTDFESLQEEQIEKQIFIVLPPHIKLQEKTLSYSVFVDSHNVLLEFKEHIKDSYSFITVKPDLITTIHNNNEHLCCYFLSDEEIAQRYTYGEEITFLYEDVEIDAKEYVERRESRNYQTITYTNNKKDYAALVNRSRDGLVDIVTFQEKLEASCDHQIDFKTPVCILYLEDHADTKYYHPAKRIISQDFQKLTKEFPEYEFLLLMDKDLKLDNSTIRSLPFKKKYRDKDGIIDKEISLFEMNSHNWIVILPDGRCQIFYGRRGDFIRMIESLENE